MHAVAAKAVALREAAAARRSPGTRGRWSRTRKALADGLAAEGMRPVSGGTDTHLALIDLRALGVTGATAEKRCDAARITLNKNADPVRPASRRRWRPGIRVGTAAVTTQGMAEPR